MSNMTCQLSSLWTYQRFMTWLCLMNTHFWSFLDLGSIFRWGRSGCCRSNYFGLFLDLMNTPLVGCNCCIRYEAIYLSNMAKKVEQAGKQMDRGRDGHFWGKMLIALGLTSVSNHFCFIRNLTGLVDIKNFWSPWNLL